MKVCKIIDESRDNIVIAYLFHYEKSDAYTIEISDELRAEDAPILFDTFIERGTYTADPEFSKRWVENRVIPRDRQNLGTILRDNGLREYDSFKLLMLAEGRCAQDDLCITQVREDQLPAWVQERRRNKIEFALPLRDWNLILIYGDKSIWRVDTKPLLADNHLTKDILKRADKHSNAHLMTGGSGIEWASGVFLTAEELRGKGKRLPLNKEELDALIKSYVVDSADISNELGCSRQYVSKLVRENGLEEFKATSSSRLFTRSELDRIKD